jgi:hypothetical protein
VLLLLLLLCLPHCLSPLALRRQQQQQLAAVHLLLLLHALCLDCQQQEQQLHL